MVVVMAGGGGCGRWKRVRGVAWCFRYSSWWSGGGGCYPRVCTVASFPAAFVLFVRPLPCLSRVTKRHNIFYDRLLVPSLFSIFTVIPVYCLKCMSEKFFNDMVCTLSDGSVLWYAQSEVIETAMMLCRITMAMLLLLLFQRTAIADNLGA